LSPSRESRSRRFNAAILRLSSRRITRQKNPRTFPFSDNPASPQNCCSRLLLPTPVLPFLPSPPPIGRGCPAQAFRKARRSPLCMSRDTHTHTHTHIQTPPHVRPTHSTCILRMSNHNPSLYEYYFTISVTFLSLVACSSNFGTPHIPLLRFCSPEVVLEHVGSFLDRTTAKRILGNARGAASGHGMSSHF